MQAEIVPVVRYQYSEDRSQLLVTVKSFEDGKMVMRSTSVKVGNISKDLLPSKELPCSKTEKLKSDETESFSAVHYT